MFQRYTETARRVIFSARYLASRVGSPDIDSEHILLGLLREDQVLALRFLGSPWAAQEVWKVIEQIKPVKESDPALKEIPLTTESKCALTSAFEEADEVSSVHVSSGHLLLGLLHKESGFAAKILSERGLDLACIRGDLLRAPHDDSANGKFIEECAPLPQDVVELRNRVASIMKNVNDAIAANDFTKVKTLSDELSTESDKLFLQYRKLGLNDWLYNQD